MRLPQETIRAKRDGLPLDPEEIRAFVQGVADGAVGEGQAAAFAMTLLLHERGVFTWAEWAAELADAIRDAQAQGDPDRGDTYYVHWLTALERIATAKGCVTRDGLEKRKNAWEVAARRTPHGRPIELD